MRFALFYDYARYAKIRYLTTLTSCRVCIAAAARTNCLAGFLRQKQTALKVEGADKLSTTKTTKCSWSSRRTPPMLIFA